MSRAGSWVAVVAEALAVVAVATCVVNRAWASAFSTVLLMTFPVVSWVILRARPRNGVAWCFLGASVLLGLERVGEQTARLGLRRHWPELVDHVAAWLQAWTWFPGLFLLITVALLRFPDGRLPGRQWLWLERMAWFAMIVWSLGVGAAATTLTARELMSQSTPDPKGWAEVVFTAGEAMFFVVFVCALGSVASLVVRYRHGTAVEREQTRWVMWGAALPVLIEIVLDVGGSVLGPWPDWTQTIGEGIGFVMIAVATGVAITRYKLYEIERVVSRTVSYALVLVVLGALYVGILVALATLVPADLGQVGVAAATLVVSIVAVPLTRRVRRVVDRRFNRSRFDAERIAGAFAARLRARPERGDVPSDLLDVVHRTVAPTHAGVWLVKT